HPLEPRRERLHLQIVAYPVLQRPRLTDVEHVAPGIEHAIDARARFQALHHLTDRRDARFEIRLRGRDRVCRTLLIEALGAAGIGRSSCRGSGHARQIGRKRRYLKRLTGLNWWESRCVVSRSVRAPPRLIL